MTFSGLSRDSVPSNSDSEGQAITGSPELLTADSGKNPSMGNPWLDDLYRDYKPSTTPIPTSTVKPAAGLETRRTPNETPVPVPHPTPTPTPARVGTPAPTAPKNNNVENINVPGNNRPAPEKAIFTPGLIKPELTIPDRVPWVEDNLYDAYARAYQEKKPLVVMFHADWCNYCKRMSNEALVSQDFRQFAQEAVFVKLNVEKDDQYGNVKQLMLRLGIEEYPSMAVMDVSGEQVNVLGRIVGYHNPPQFMNVFRQVMPKHIVDRHLPLDPGVYYPPTNLAGTRVLAT